ncbi:MAG: glycosyltransferase family 39 protein [Zavarzinella sp.]
MMSCWSHQRWFHYLLITCAYALLTLPNLGSHTLWDMDEGVNGEASREMLEIGNYITPYFNYEIRVAKPVMLYWLQTTSIRIFGINEFALRFASVFCCWLAVLLCYELARTMFGSTVGLLSGIILASCIQFCILAHAATPDASLMFFLMAVMACFYIGSHGGRRWWFFPCGIAAGLAVLTKGPIGIGLPGLIILLYLIWDRRLKIVWDRRLIYGFLLFYLVALPWYILVAVDTKGIWPTRFFMGENLNRFQAPMQGHSGGIWYYPALLLVLFAPWSFVIVYTLWKAVDFSVKRDRDTAPEELEERSAIRYLVSWFFVWLIVFSAAATKLPNYILPLYPALAILTARVLVRWFTKVAEPAKSIQWLAWSGLFLTGAITIVGILIAGGTIPLPGGKFKPFIGLSTYAWIGVFPLISSAFVLRALITRNYSQVLPVLAVTGVLYTAGLSAFPPVVFNDYKAPANLIRENNLLQPDSDLRLASHGWFRESAVFYAQREIKILYSIKEVNQFLEAPTGGYLFVLEQEYPRIQKELTTQPIIVGSHYDFLSNGNVLVLWNGYPVSK